MTYRQTAADTTPEELATTRVPDRYVKEMIDGLRDAFGKLVRRERYPMAIDAKPKDVCFRLYLGDASIPFFMHTAMEPGRDAVIHALFRHLEGSGLTPDRIQVCPLEGCGNVFVLGSHARTDRKRYCSVRCSGLAASKAYRERQAAKMKASRSREKQSRARNKGGRK
jgi:predicted RNA-binding Zn ribbon-like protein